LSSAPCFSEAFIALDDTTGWHHLESSIGAYHQLVRGLGASLAVGDDDEEGADVGSPQSNGSGGGPRRRVLSDAVLALLITDASKHTSRYVRESSYAFVAIVATDTLRGHVEVRRPGPGPGPGGTPGPHAAFAERAADALSR